MHKQFTHSRNDQQNRCQNVKRFVTPTLFTQLTDTLIDTLLEHLWWEDPNRNIDDKILKNLYENQKQIICEQIQNWIIPEMSKMKTKERGQGAHLIGVYTNKRKWSKFM